MAKSSKAYALFAFGVWTALGLFWATRLYFAYNQDSHVVPWSEALIWGLLDFYVWGALSPLVIALARKIRFGRKRWIFPALFHLPTSIAFALAQLLIFSVLFKISGGLDYVMQSYTNPDIWDVWGGMIIGKIHSSIMIYWGILIATLAFDYHRRFRSERLRAAEIETRLAKAELAALKMQLHPHFLFNTLNTIAALVREQPSEAERTIVRLSDLLRSSLKRSADSLIPLREEIAFIEKYLEIERIRFADRLTTHIEVPQETFSALIPALILQPLVENAVKHGIAPLEREGTLVVKAAIEDSMLALSVEDNGPGLPENWEDTSKERIGLTNTRERMRQMYGAEQSFTIEACNPSGVRISLRIPLSRASAHSKEIRSQ